MKKIIWRIVVLLALSVLSLNSYGDNNLTYDETDINLSSEIIGVLENNHFTKKKFTSVKENSLKKYFELLDPNKRFFLKKEVSQYLNSEKLQSPYDQKTSLDKAFEIFGLYQSRYKERHEFLELLLQDIENLDLKQDRRLLRNREIAVRSDSLESLKTLWKDFLINEVIQLLLNGNNLNEAQQKLVQRHQNQLNYFSQTKAGDVLDIYFNSIALSYGPHNSYMSPKRTEDFDIDMRLSLEGIGALLENDGMYTSISSLVPGGPAEKSKKLRPNDKIVGVGQEKEETITNIIGWRIDDVVQLIRGPKYTKVKLEIIPATSLDESDTKIIEITRNIVKLEDQAAEKRILSINKENINFRVGIIELPAFYMDFDAYQNRRYDYRSSSKDVKKLIKSLKDEKIDGLILDLRNNPGGSLIEANALAQLFLGGGIKVQVKTSRGSIHGLGERRGFQSYDGPLVILVNRFSASAAEILAGAIQDYNRGLVLGTDTFGKGTVQRVELVSKGQIKFTESKFYRVSGRSTQNRGVSPDIYLPSSIEMEETGEEKLSGSLKYDTISGVKVKNFNRLTIPKGLLIYEHKTRIKESILFNHYENLKAWRKAQKNDDFVDLDLEKRRTKKQKAEQELLALENKTRERLGLNTFSSYKEFLEREAVDGEPSLDEEILIEAANVLSDFISKAYNPVVKLNKAS